MSATDTFSDMVASALAKADVSTIDHLTLALYEQVMATCTRRPIRRMIDSDEFRDMLTEHGWTYAEYAYSYADGGILMNIRTIMIINMQHES